MQPIKQAVRNFGSQEALAAALDVSQPTVSEWVRGERPVPPARCVEIELHETNRNAEIPVSRIDLRPDDWFKFWPELKRSKPAPKATAGQGAL